MKTVARARSSRWDWLNGEWPWKLVVASFLMLGVALRLVEVGYDRYDIDEYHLQMGIQQAFGDYYKAFEGTDSVQFGLHFWLTNRLLGDSLIAYRALTLLAGIALLVITALWLRRWWPAEKALAPIVLALFAVGADALFLSRYGMFAYGSTYLQAAGLLFLFMRLAEGPLKRRQWLWISAVLPFAAFFADEFLIVSLAVGACVVFAFRWTQADAARSPRHVPGWAWEMAPLLIYPLVFAIRQVAFPYTFWGAGQRVDQLDLYYSSSGYPSGILGAIEFLVRATYSQFWSLLGPAGNSGAAPVQPIFIGGCAALATPAVIQIIRGRAGRRASFVALFLALALAGVALGGLLGVYPYGVARYVPFLAMPSAILIGLGGAWYYRWISGRLGSARFWNALLLVGAVALLAGGVYWCVARSQQIAGVRQEDDRAIARLAALQPDLILTDTYISEVLYTKAPSVYAGLHEMGPGTYYGWGRDEVPPAMAETIAGTAAARPADSILVVLFPHELGRTDHYRGFAQRYPLWSDLIEEHFQLAEVVQSMHLEGRLYRRK